MERAGKFPVIDMHCDTIALFKACEVQAENVKKGIDTVLPDFFKVTDEELAGGIRLRKNGHHLDAERLRSSNYMCQCLGLCSSLSSAKRAGKTPWEYLQILCDKYDSEVAECSDLVRPVTTAAEMEQNFREGYVSVMKTMEDSLALEGDPDRLEEMYRRGVRVASLTWNYENALAYGHRITDAGLELDDVNGLKPAGFEFVKLMEEMGMIIDVSHLNDAGIRDVFDTVRASTPVIATHSNARRVCNHPRNLPDEFLLQLADHGGVTGINFCHVFLNERFRDGAEKLSLISDMCEHMKYIKNLAGIDVLGLGSDFDGVTSVLEVNGCGEIQKIAEGMEKAGFTDDEIEKVFYKNTLRVFREVLH